MHASIITIGTELTTGQIINKNASWIAQQLDRMGIPTEFQLSTPDSLPMILSALNFVQSRSDIIFVSGGLGPTSDDITREAICQWAKLDLLFNHKNWEKLQNKLLDRGLPIRENHKNEAHFPFGSHILSNSAGTADGFYININGSTVFVLPGPPPELENIWLNHIQSWLADKTKLIDPLLSVSWDTMGIPESELAEKIENILPKIEIKKQKLQVGYRVHLPYVEFKLSYPKSKEQSFNELISNITYLLKPHTISTNKEDIAVEFVQKISHLNSISINDFTCGNYLIRRLTAIDSHFFEENKFLFANFKNNDNSALILTISSDDIDTAKVEFRFHEHHEAKVFAFPLPKMKNKDRRQKYFAECAIIFWTECLRRLP